MLVSITSSSAADETVTAMIQRMTLELTTVESSLDVDAAAEIFGASVFSLSVKDAILVHRYLVKLTVTSVDMPGAMRERKSAMLA